MKKVTQLAAAMLFGAVIATLVIAASRTSFEQDPVKLSPQYYQVLLDNQHVRVLEYRLKPGEKEPMHSHIAGVVYSFNDSVVQNTFPDGTTSERSAKGGSAFWRDPLTHALENTGTTEVHALAVEIKSLPKQ